MPLPTLRIATAHISPHLLSTSTTLLKTLTSITHASTHSASLISFPESSIPCFPIWSSLLPPSHHATHSLFSAFADQSIYFDGPEITTIRDAARRHKISVNLGFSEKARWSEGTLWNSNLLIDETGNVRVHHRKLMPTFFEKLTWGMGDGEGLRTADIGVRAIDDNSTRDKNVRVKVGTLICGENTNPLARYTMMAQGQHIHVSTWPAVWPTRMPKPSSPTDNSTGRAEPKKNYDNILANRLRAGAHCFEAKCYGVMSAAYLSPHNISDLLSRLPSEDVELKQQVEYALQNTSQAASMFLDPTGTPVAGFIVNEKGQREEREMLREEEGVLFADLDLEECVEGKQFHDVVGGYQRLDVFELKVDRKRREPVRFEEVEG